MLNDRTKQCDQLSPTCTRCARLQIPCVGAGQQRYKFVKHKIPYSSHAGASPTSDHDEHGENKSTEKLAINRNPSCEFNPSRSRLISALDTSDLRYNLGCYGDFLKHIPKHLGQDKALDASVRALVSAYSYHHTRQQQCEALTDYVKALRELRLSLESPKRTVTAELLCAIYLVMISQVCVQAMFTQIADR